MTCFEMQKKNNELEKLIIINISLNLAYPACDSKLK
jgi:hypothetical protein